jgi:hypothetical protein
MWAQPVDEGKDLYKLDSIPFYAPVAPGDIIFAEFDNTEQMLTYRKTIKYSGSSTVQVVILDTSIDINKLRNTFNDIGCISEQLNDRYFAMEIPADIAYLPIKRKLIELEDANVISYAEPCLSTIHQYDGQ